MRNPRVAGVVALILLSLSASAPALTGVPSTQNWGPNGNGTLPHEDDLQWVSFHDAKVTANTDAGIYSARFSPMLQKMDGQNLVITGYMMPVSVAMATTHFVLTRRSATCPFCPPNEPTEAIEVMSQRLIKPTASPITIEGRLHLVASSERGLFFRIDSAKVW